MSLSLSGGLGAILNLFFESYIPQGHTAEEVVYLLTFPSLFIGIGEHVYCLTSDTSKLDVGNFIVLPFTLWLGRRPTFLIANLILLVATIGAAVNNGYEGHLTARVFQGLATGATESVNALP
jgi:MFS family permease